MLCYITSNKNGAILSAVKCWILGDTTLYKCVIYDASWRNARSFLMAHKLWVCWYSSTFFPNRRGTYQMHHISRYVRYIGNWHFCTRASDNVADKICWLIVVKSHWVHPTTELHQVTCTSIYQRNHNHNDKFNFKMSTWLLINSDVFECD